MDPKTNPERDDAANRLYKTIETTQSVKASPEEAKRNAEGMRDGEGKFIRFNEKSIRDMKF